MTDAQALLAGVAVTAALLAGYAGWREARRRGRSDPDAVGMIDWVTVQYAAFVALAVAGLLALHQ